MTKILLTGATGFLGSHIAESLTDNGFELFALKRENSDCWRCEEFYDKIKWIIIDNESLWKDEVIKSGASVIVHSAWLGVEAQDRDNLEIQVQNLEFIHSLLEISKKLRVKKFISLGSQAEYGCTNVEVDECTATNPITAYGVTKIASLGMIESYCSENNIQWIWMRLFSIFGEKEGKSWLIPNLISKMKVNSSIDFTIGEQKYAYLYVKDFVEIIIRTINMNVDSGIYNVSSNQVLPLKDVIQKIGNIVNPEFKLNFGVLPYRNNQSMHIQGNMTKLFKQIGVFQFSNFDEAINKTNNYYLLID